MQMAVNSSTAASPDRFLLTLADDASRTVDAKEHLFLVSIAANYGAILGLALSIVALIQTGSHLSAILVLYAVATVLIGIAMMIFGDTSRIIYLLFLPHNFAEVAMLVLTLTRGRLSWLHLSAFWTQALIMSSLVLYLPLDKAAGAVGAHGQIIDWMVVFVFSFLAFNNRPSVSKMKEGEWRGLPLFAFGAFVHAFSGFLVGVSAPFFTVFMLAFLVTMPAYGVCAIVLNQADRMIWRLGRWQWLLSVSLTAGMMAILACIDLIKVKPIQ